MSSPSRTSPFGHSRNMLRLTLAAVIVFVASICGLLEAVPRRIDAGLSVGLTRAQTDLRFLTVALERAKVEAGALPSDSVGLAALVPSFLANVPHDPWGNAYVYRRVAVEPGYEVYSRGRDGLDEHGRGDDVTGHNKSYRCSDYEVNCGVTLSVVGSVASLVFGCSSLALLGYRLVAFIVQRRRQQPTAS